MILETICRSVVNVAKMAGEFALNEITHLTVDHIRFKGDRDIVTHIDQSCERRIVSQLAKLMPEAGFLTEEETVAHEIKDVTWIIDPLDGTTNYVHGIPFFSVSIALMMHGRIVLGVVYNPGLDECYYSYEGEGVFLNDQPVQVSRITSLGDAVIATGFPYEDLKEVDRYTSLLKVLMTHSHGVRRFGSAAIDLAWVAGGRFDAFYEAGLNPWDVAAGAFLVQQAGGVVCDFSGGTNFLFGKEIIASNKNIFPRFFDLTNSYLIGSHLIDQPEKSSSS
jgi:myo-inositol-1(or 4)-monophosphatase